MGAMRRGLWILLVPVLLAAGCGGSAPGIQVLPGSEGDFIQAKRAYEEGNYVRAVELLTAFLDAHPGSNQLDEALVLLGEAHQRTGESLLAVQDYERLIRDFPQSSFREQAEFGRAEASYRDAQKPSLDPEGTETALSLFRAYLIRYPEGTKVEEARNAIEDCLDRLAVKAYLNAQTYRRLNRPRAEVIYLEKALTTKPEFSRTGEALAALGRAYARVGEFQKAFDTWQRLLDYATPERIEARPKLASLRQEAEAALRELAPAVGENPSP
jgi:outer membrane assembly lipoprotein YfiO